MGKCRKIRSIIYAGKVSSGKVSLGKCRWENVGWENVPMGNCRLGKSHGTDAISSAEYLSYIYSATFRVSVVRGWPDVKQSTTLRRQVTSQLFSITEG